MGVEYKAILWNRNKKFYDLALVGCCMLYLFLFVILTYSYHPGVAPPTIIVRSTGTLAIILLHVILAIGPLSRLDSRFLPLLYNRRHLGVTMFFFALLHGGFSILQFHAFGDLNPLVSVLVSNTHYGSVMRFPFQSLGLLALIVLLLMAVTSHDFWLHNLSPRVWKGLHMLVFIAYVLIVLHVMLGVVQLENSPWLVGALALGLVTLISLHLITGFQSYRRDQSADVVMEKDFVKVCAINEIRENKARLAVVGDRSIAIFRYNGQLSAVDNACRHQNGPLSEGKIVDGCITCPWHGYQYLPESGTSPPPFEEKISTYNLRIVESTVWVNPTPNSPGTSVVPCNISNNQNE